MAFTPEGSEWEPRICEEDERVFEITFIFDEVLKCQHKLQVQSK